METRYLTKSHFKLAMECPTKLFYIGKEEYANKNLEDPFLEALSGGGFQVGELDTLAMVMIYEAWADMIKED